MKRILVNATQQEELRVAIVDGQKLCDLDIEADNQRQKKGNIYKGVVSSIAPSLNAVFVDYGGQRHGFLSLKEISKRYFTNNFKGPLRDRLVKDLIKEGQELIVQIAREERGNKGASLSTFISLVGRYVVLLPNNPRAQGVSQRIGGRERNDMLGVVQQLDKTEDEGLIVRTAGTGSKKAALQKNLDYLRQLWQAIEKAAAERPAPFLIYQEANVVIQVLRDNMNEGIDEVIIDNQEIYEQAKAFVSMVLPRSAKKLKLYDGAVPLFNRMQIEGQIETLYQREVFLPSGGSIVIDHTEALTTIDINSARATQKKDLEQTALATNLEAAEEIARQLRLRDLGGLFVIDFIDMLSFSNRTKVERKLSEALRGDRARTQLGKISKFGLLEMSRQHLRPSLGDASEIVCPRCNGRGFIRTVGSCALVVLRLIEEEAMKDKTKRVVGQVPVEVNSFLLNEKRTNLADIENRYGVEVSIVADIQMETPHYKIMRHRDDGNTQINRSSAELASIRSSRERRLAMMGKQSKVKEVAAIPSLFIPEKLPIKESLTKLVKKLFSKKTVEKSAKQTSKKRFYKQKKRQRPNNKQQQTRSRNTKKKDKARVSSRSSSDKRALRRSSRSRASSDTKGRLRRQHQNAQQSDDSLAQVPKRDFASKGLQTSKTEDKSNRRNERARPSDIEKQPLSESNMDYSKSFMNQWDRSQIISDSTSATAKKNSKPSAPEERNNQNKLSEKTSATKAVDNTISNENDKPTEQTSTVEQPKPAVKRRKRPSGIIAKAPSSDSALPIEASGMTQVETKANTLNK